MCVPSWSETATSTAISTKSLNITADREDYSRTVKREMEEWRVKLADFGARASDQTTKTGQEAEIEISRAWARVEQAAGRLDGAGRAEWRDAKAGYERAGKEMDAAWAKFYPERK
jgi:hypothetical protein